jgi:hypothetical protein
MYHRLKSSGIGFDRPYKNTHYKMLKHKKRKKNPNRRKLLKTARKRREHDGLSDVKYELYDIIEYPLFTHILINVGDPEYDAEVTEITKIQMNTK